MAKNMELIELDIDCTKEATGYIRLPYGYVIKGENEYNVPNNMSDIPLAAGKFQIKKS